MSSEKEVAASSKLLLSSESQPILKNIEYLLKKLTLAELKPFFTVLCDISGLEVKKESRIITLFEAMARYWIESQNNNRLKNIEFKSFLKNTDLEELIDVYNEKILSSKISYDVIHRYLLDVPKLTETKIKECDPLEASILSHQLDSSRILLLLNDISEKILAHEKMIDFLENIENEDLNHKDAKKVSLVQLLNYIKYDGVLSNEKQLQLYNLFEGEEISFFQKNELRDKIYNHLVNKEKDEFFNALEEYAQFSFKKPSSELSLEEKVTVFNDDMFDSLGQKTLIELMLIFYDESIFNQFLKQYDWSLNIPIAHQIELVEKEELVHKIIYKLPYLYAIEHNLSCAKDLSIHTDISKSTDLKLNIRDTIKYYHYSFEKDFFSYNFSQLHFIKMIEHDIFYDKIKFTKNNNVINELSIFEVLLDRSYLTAFSFLAKKIKEKDNQFNMNQILKDYIKKNSSISKVSLLDEDNLSIEDLLELKEVIQKNSDDMTVIRLLTKFKGIAPDNLKNKPVEIISEEIKSSNDISWYDKLSVFKHLKDADNAKTKILTRMLEEKQMMKKLIRLDNEDFFDNLVKTMPNFQEVINYYKGQFRQNHYGNKKRINPILLLGEPGIGKTYFSKQLAKELKTGYEFIDMGSLSAGWILTGMDGTWQDAKQGKILNAMLESSTFNPIILLDEIDKASEGKHNPLNPLYQLLEEVNAKEFTDEYLDVKFDASGIIYIACANSIQMMPEPLLSRFKIFNVPSPTNEQLHDIIVNIYKESIGDNPILNASLNDNVIELLKTNSLREAKVLIEDAISNALLTYERNELDYMISNQKTISLEPQHFKSNIKKKEFGFNI